MSPSIVELETRREFMMVPGHLSDFNLNTDWTDDLESLSHA